MDSVDLILLTFKRNTFFILVIAFQKVILIIIAVSIAYRDEILIFIVMGS